MHLMDTSTWLTPLTGRFASRSALWWDTADGFCGWGHLPGHCFGGGFHICKPSRLVKCLEVAAAKENQSFQGWKRLEQIGTLFNIRTGWWFGTCFIFPHSWEDDPIWLILFRGVETTNQKNLLESCHDLIRYFQPSRWMKPSTRPHQIDSTSWCSPLAAWAPMLDLSY